MTSITIDFLTNGSEDATTTFLFTHGAGAPMDSPFMSDVAAALAHAGILVKRFEFPYMRARRKGQRKGPDRQAVLLETWRKAVASVDDERHVYIGGKSLGGRMASMVAQECDVTGVICFGYPFHPPGRPEKLRTEHMKDISIPVLILQGERDPFGSPQEVADYELSHHVRTEWIPDGDHSFVPRKRSGIDLADNIALAIRFCLEFMTETSKR